MARTIADTNDRPVPPVRAAEGTRDVSRTRYPERRGGEPPVPTEVPLALRAGIGVFSGFAIGALIADLYVLNEREAVHPPLIPVLLGLGVISGATLAVIAGSRELTSRSARVGMAGLIGALLGFVPSFVLVLVVVGRPQALLPAFFGPMVAGGVIGAVVGRVRVGGRMTTGEIMLWVGLTACVLGIVTAAFR
jgi:hypothetical protein